MIAGANHAATANQIGTATITGCMGEMGYLFKTKSEHLAMCDAIAEQRRRQASAVPATKSARRAAKSPSLSEAVNSPLPSSAPK